MCLFCLIDQRTINLNLFTILTFYVWKNLIYLYIFRVFVFQVGKFAEDCIRNLWRDWTRRVGTSVWASQEGVFCDLCFVFAMLSCLFIAALWSSAGKGLTSWLACFWCSLVFCHFRMWCPGSSVVLDCIFSWSLPSYLLCGTNKGQWLFHWPADEKKTFVINLADDSDSDSDEANSSTLLLRCHWFCWNLFWNIYVEIKKRREKIMKEQNKII